MEEFKDLRVFIHVNSDDYLERHYTEETADWRNHETCTSSSSGSSIGLGFSWCQGPQRT